MNSHLHLRCPRRCLWIRICGNDRDARLEAIEAVEQFFTCPLREQPICPTCGRPLTLTETG